MVLTQDRLSLAKRAVLALMVATMFFGRQITSWTHPANRYLYHWQRSDALLLIAAVVLTGLLVLAIEAMLHRLGGSRTRCGLRLAFVLGVGQLVVALVLTPNAELPIQGAAAASVATAGVSLAGFWRAEALVVRSVVRTCFFFAPLPFLLFGQMVSWRSWRTCPDGLLEPSPSRDARPVFLLIFDEWSLERSWDGTTFLPQLRRLRGLAERSFVFVNARTPGSATYVSIPRILFQENGQVVVANGEAKWETTTCPFS